MFRDDQNQDVLKTAAQATRARIRRDRARAPRALKKVFSFVASKLFDRALTAAKAWQAAGVKDRAPLFKTFAGTTLGRYITAARIEVASVLIETTALDLASISELVGCTHYPTFAKHYEALKGKKPSEVARERLAPPLIGHEQSLRAGRGLLDEQAIVRHLEDLFRIYPTTASRILGGGSEPRTVVDGARTDRLKAQGLWWEIRDLPFAEKCREVQRVLFHSTVLFDLLRERSRREGRESRRRGVELAELALVSLDGSDQVFGERIHDLRALGWADLGNALRLALDFSSSAGAFEQAEREWSRPRAQRDLSVLARIRALKGSLRMMRREYAGATQDLDRACSLFRRLDQPREEARALIQRAAIHIYAGKLGEAVEDLREAAGLIDEEEEKELASAIRGNLANALALGGKTESAAKELDRARQIHRAIDDPLGLPKLDWIDGLVGENHGDLERAKRFYQAARAGFLDAEERRYYSLVSVDLMIVHALQDDWQSVSALASETLPMLSSLNLHRETLATVGLLAKPAEAESLSRRLLNDLRVALRRDPLTS